MNFPIRLAHPEHGAMHVYNEEELKKHEALGWGQETKEAAPVSAVVASEPKKRGRPRKVAA